MIVKAKRCVSIHFIAFLPLTVRLFQASAQCLRAVALITLLYALRWCPHLLDPEKLPMASFVKCSLAQLPECGTSCFHQYFLG